MEKVPVYTVSAVARPFIKPVRKNFRITEESGQILAEASERLGMDETAVVEALLAKLKEQPDLLGPDEVAAQERRSKK